MKEIPLFVVAALVAALELIVLIIAMRRYPRHHQQFARHLAGVGSFSITVFSVLVVVHMVEPAIARIVTDLSVIALYLLFGYCFLRDMNKNTPPPPS